MKYFIVLAIIAQIAVVFSYQVGYDYYVPRPKIKPLQSGGLYMSLPHRPGIEEVDFHINLNKPLNSGDPGQFVKKVGERWNGRWSFVDRQLRINSGDTVYFRVTVRKDGKQYSYDDGRFFVTEGAFSSEESNYSGSSEEHYRRY